MSATLRIITPVFILALASASFAGPGDLIWSYATGGAVTSSPAILEDNVIVGCDDYIIRCLDATTGELVWSYATVGEVASSPSLADDLVYIGSADGKLYCLDVEDGSLEWSYDAPVGIMSSPAVAEGRVYFGCNDTDVYCLNAETGAFVWSYNTGHSVWSSPAVSDGYVYFGSWDNYVYCVDASDGSLEWSYQTNNPVWGSPAVCGQYVYIGSWDDSIYCLNKTTGALVWSYQTGDAVRSSPAVCDGRVYFGSWDGFVYCLDASSGGFVWSSATGGVVDSSPAVCGDYVYIGSNADQIHCLGKASPERVWTYVTGGDVVSAPAVAGGCVFVGCADGVVRCVQAGIGDEFEWPQFSFDAANTGCQSLWPDPSGLLQPLDQGWNLFGYSYPIESAWADCTLTDGMTTLRIREAAEAGWVQRDIFAFDVNTGYITVSPDGENPDLLPGCGYWLLTFVPGLSLRIQEPTYDMAEFWPLEVGNLWVMEHEPGVYSTHEITGTATVNGNNCFVMRNDDPGGAGLTYMTLSAGGVVCYREEQEGTTEYDEFDPCSWWVPFRFCRPGDSVTRSWTKTDYDGGTPTWTVDEYMFSSVIGADPDFQHQFGPFDVVLTITNNACSETAVDISQVMGEMWCLARGIGPVYAFMTERWQEGGGVQSFAAYTEVVYAVVGGVPYGLDPRP